MGLKASFLTISLVLTVLQYCCAQEKLFVYKPNETKIITAAYDARELPQYASMPANGMGVPEKVLIDIISNAIANGTFYLKISDLEKNALQDETEQINWLIAQRLLAEAKAFLATLHSFKMNGAKSNWKLEDEMPGQKQETQNENEVKQIIIIAGFGGNGYSAGEVGLMLHDLGYNVFVVGMPSRYGDRTENKECMYLRKKLIVRYIQYGSKDTKGNFFKYIEVNVDDITKGRFSDEILNQIPKGEYLYLEGHIGIGAEFNIREFNKYPLATIHFLNHIKSTYEKATIISIDSAVHTHPIFGGYRVQEEELLPYCTPHGSILINFVPPYVLTPPLQVDGQTMAFKSFIKEVSQMESVTFAVAIVKDIYDFMDNETSNGAIKTKWELLSKKEKALPPHLQSKPNYGEKRICVSAQNGVHEFYYLHQNLFLNYKPFPAISFESLEVPK